MSVSVYLGNVSFDTTSEDLNSFLFGSVSGLDSVDLKTRHDGRSKGWALLTFNSAEAAQEGIEALNDTTLDNRTLYAREDRGEAPPRNTTTRQPRQNQFQSAAPGNTVYVGNLPWSTDDAALAELFQDFSPIETKVMFTSGGRSRGFAIVTLESEEQASDFIAKNAEIVYGERTLNIRFDNSGRRTAAPVSGPSGLSIYVGNLPPTIASWQDLKDLFEEFAPEHADVKTGRDGQPRGWGTVRFGAETTTTSAIADFNGREVDGNIIEVRLDNRA